MDELERMNMAVARQINTVSGGVYVGGDTAMQAPAYPAFTVSPCKNGYIIQKGSERWVATNEDQLVQVLKVIAVTDKVSG